MSGTNPFRRRAQEIYVKDGTATVNAASLGGTEARIPPINTDVQRPTKPKTPKTGKTVRIISPHSATSDDDDGTPQNQPFASHNATSPPPSRTISPELSDNESTEDPFSAGSDGTIGSAEDEGTRENTLINSKTPQSNPSALPRMPTNPFAKTLANLETENNLESPGLPRERSTPKWEPSASRPHYDVDDFKRLLLTGEKTVSGSSTPVAPPVSFQSQHSLGDSSSNTDASSISRQSIFEPAAGPLQESPGTSHECSPLDDDGQQLVGGQSPSLLKTKPSTPKHRHGKLVKVNAPLTVSFEDPSLSLSSSNTTPKSPRTPGDVDKPLPPLPPTSDITGCSDDTAEIGKSDPFSTTTRRPSSPTVSKRVAPAPPLSRRHSQLKSKPFSGSERSGLVSENTMTRPIKLSPSPPTTALKAPPPPPPRRAGALVRVNSSSSTSTSASFPPMQSHTSADDITSNSSKPQPPALPNHSPTISSVKRQRIQPLSGSPITAPAPPPRRRGSSQSSYTPSSLSGDYRSAVTDRLRSDSGASSISHLQMTPMTPTPSSSESKDVMADLSALQREVDELRQQFRD